MTPAPLSVLQALDGASVGTADAGACATLQRQSKRLRAWLDAFDSEVAARLDTLAESGESFGSEAAHVHNSGVSARDAARLTRRARALSRLADVADALASGSITAGHVDQLAAVAEHLRDDVREMLFARSSELLTHARAHDPGRFGRHVRDLARRLERDAGVDRAEQQRNHTSLSWWLAADGMFHLHARLHPLLGERIITALEHESRAMVARGEATGDPEFVGRAVDRNRLMAEALGTLVSAGHGDVRPTVADVSVLVDAATLSGAAHDDDVCEGQHGAAVPIESVRALLCNGTVTPVVVDRDGTVLDVGRTRRTANRAQRRALRAMYRTCAAAGCDVPFDRCEIHHIEPWELGGSTSLSNLLPLCSRHHHVIHARRWRLDLAPDRTLTVTDPGGGVVMVTAPDVPIRHVGQRRTMPDRATPLAS